MADVLAAEPLADPDYVALVDAFDVKRVRDVRGDLRLMVAARLGKPRLLDNLGVRAPDR
jgi:pantothenate synthetase